MNTRYAAAAVVGLSRCLLAQNCEPAWSSVGTGGADQTLPVVNAMAAYQPIGAPSPMLVVGGTFESIGGVTASSVAVWDGHEFVALGDPHGSIRALDTFDDGTGTALYAAGSFTFPGAPPTSANVVRWDGHEWSPVGSIKGTFYDIETFDDGSGPALWVTGSVMFINGQGTQRDVARWDGKQWSVTTNWANGSFGYDLHVHDSGDGPALLVAGDEGVSRLRDNQWEHLGNWVFTTTIALGGFDGGGGSDLYASWGYFSRWDGVTWVDLDMEFSLKAKSFAAFDSAAGPALAAVGKFGTIGGVPASSVAAWDGLMWSALGAGLSKAGGQGTGNRAMVFDDGRGPALFVVGEFDTAGGLPAPSVARWGCPAACLGDCDSSGSLDLFDFLCFANQFNAADPSADCDANGILDLFDFLCFVNAFNEGC